jgi:DNA-directed RNA polymerase specialized sigma24 family protein
MQRSTKVVNDETDVEDVMQQAYINAFTHLHQFEERSRFSTYRTVFMLRDIEGLSTTETGEGLGLREEAVKTRLHRARAMIRRAVTVRISAVATGAFQFNAPRCDRVVAVVLARISQCQ